MRDIIDINSNDNSLFVTSQCNNRCLMCSQPPLCKNDIDFHFQRNLSLISTAPKSITDIGITGGEPTMLGIKLFDLIKEIRNHLPNTLIHILSNGRAFADILYTNIFSSVGTDNLLLGIPLHSDYSGDHDFITQKVNSYDETMKGLYNLDRYRLDIELRIVINKINYTRLPKLSAFIYKNLPFVKYISFIGMENTGYSIKNHKFIWIDPTEYKDELEYAVNELAGWGMNVSIFNLPLCLIKENLYPHARKSISDWKTTYLTCCNSCQLKNECCGLFNTSKNHSPQISPIQFESLK